MLGRGGSGIRAHARHLDVGEGSDARSRRVNDSPAHVNVQSSSAVDPVRSAWHSGFHAEPGSSCQRFLLAMPMSITLAGSTQGLIASSSTSSQRLSGASASQGPASCHCSAQGRLKPNSRTARSACSRFCSRRDQRQFGVRPDPCADPAHQRRCRSVGIQRRNQHQAVEHPQHAVGQQHQRCGAAHPQPHDQRGRGDGEGQQAIAQHRQQRIGHCPALCCARAQGCSVNSMTPSTPVASISTTL